MNGLLLRRWPCEGRENGSQGAKEITGKLPTPRRRHRKISLHVLKGA